MIERSEQYQQGYDACHRFITRSRNPYATGKDEDMTKFIEWQAGWNKRFYGEDPGELP